MAAQQTYSQRGTRVKKKAVSAGPQPSIPASDSSNIELVFGFVGPTGTDLAQVAETLKVQLRAMQYRVEEVRLSELITTYLGQEERLSQRVRTHPHLDGPRHRPARNIEPG